jgi:hypothetical protein
MDREKYEARKATEKARQESTQEQQKRAADEAELAKKKFWNHPDRIVRYAGWLQVYTLALFCATLALFGAAVVTAIILYRTDSSISDEKVIAAGTNGSDLFIENAVLLDFGNENFENGTKGRVKFFVKNVGHVRGNVELAYLVFASDRPPLPDDPIYPPEADKSFRVSVAPQGLGQHDAAIQSTDFKLSQKKILTDETDLISRNINVFYLYGRIEFTDQFKYLLGKGWAKFCFTYDTKRIKLWPEDAPAAEQRGAFLTDCGLPSYEEAGRYKQQSDD